MHNPEWINSVRESEFVFGEEVTDVVDYLFSKVFAFAVECESKNDFDIKCVDASANVEWCRSLIMDVFSPYLRSAGSAARKKKRISRHYVQKLITERKAEDYSENDIPF